MASDLQAANALRRARSRIELNGWGVGPAKPGRRGEAVPFSGWCLEDAVRGRGKRTVDSSPQVYGPGEEAALGLIELAIAELHPEEFASIEASNPPSKVAAWNDAPGRTKAEVIAVLKKALEGA